MKIGAALALMLMAFAGAAGAETGMRPQHRPAGMVVPAVVPVVALADMVFAPANDVQPLVRPRTEDPEDPFMTVVQAEVPLPVLTAAPVALTPDPALPPVVLTVAPSLPESPAIPLLSTVARSAPPVGDEVLTSVSTANQIALPLGLMHPKLRPAGGVVETALVPDLRPRLRPGEVTLAVATVPAIADALPRSIRPEARPRLRAVAKAAAEEPEAVIIPAAIIRPLPGKEGIVGKNGSVCGDPAIRGQVIPPITSKVHGCGVAEAVRITSVAGVKLSEAATIDCGTARALASWVEEGLQPRFQSDPVVALNVAGHYACRPRNNIKGNKLSEHGKGKAIDISGIVLASGEVVTVSRDWRKKGDGAALKAAYKSACGTFKTTLGPGSDGYHEDHMHFDTASGRGPYCH
jgi:Extensin-like protein C-terminus